MRHLVVKHLNRMPRLHSGKAQPARLLGRRGGQPISCPLCHVGRQDNHDHDMPFTLLIAPMGSDPFDKENGTSSLIKKLDLPNPEDASR